MSSDNTEDVTLITGDSIISKFKAYKENYTVFTTQSIANNSKYQSFVRFSKYNKILWNLYATNTTDAVINHIALVDMAKQHTVLHWNEKLVEAGKQTLVVDALHAKNIFAKDNTLNSPFTHKLFKAAGINGKHSSLALDLTTIVLGVTVSMFVVWAIGWAVDLWAINDGTTIHN